jgi:Holliday junction DNA helicase RuvA
VGPKLAIAILSGLPPSHLASAIISEDKDRLNAIPGVGKKTAERIIIDLKDKLSKETSLSLQPVQNTLSSEAYNDSLSALTNLGYTKQAAEMALKKIDWTKDLQLEEAIRCALKELVPQ